MNGEDVIHYQFIGEKGAAKKKGAENFVTFYTNREASSPGASNTQKSARADSENASSAAKVGNVSETAKESEGKDRQRYASLGVSRQFGEEAAEGEPRWASLGLSEQQLDGDDTIRFSLRQEPAPKVTKKGYAVFIYKKLKNGGYKLVPKMLSNDPGAPAQTWLNADTGYMKRDENGEPLQNTNGRASVSVNGSQAGGNKSNKLACRPGKHLAMYPNASQFKSPDGTIPKDVIFFEVEYAADPDLHKQYQRNAWELGMNDNGQYRNNQGGLPYIPKDSYYLYRTNSISEGATPMIITGAYKINRALTDAEAKELNQNAGGMWCPRKGGDLTEEKLKDMGLDDKGLKKMTESFDMDTIKESHDESDEARLLPGYKSREINWEDKDLIHSIEENGQDINDYRDGYVSPEHSEEPTIRFSLDKDKGTVVSPSKPSKAEAVLRDAVIDRLRENGMEVITDVAEGQKVLDEANGEDVMLSAKQKRALETATIADESTNKATVVSSADGAKVQNNLEVLADNYEKRPNKTRGFITDLSRSLGLEQHEASQYGTFVTENGKTVTIRVSNHNARVSFFDKNGENDGISIVISNHKNKGLLNDGNAHIIEFFYSKQSLQRADSKPLSDIIRSVSEALYSGEFKDTTGLAERQEVNAKQIREQRVGGADGLRFFRTANGEVYGFTVGGKIYVDPRIATSETPVHEYAHLWATALRNGNAEEVADRVMKDLLEGVDPRSMMDGGRSLRPDTRINVVEVNSEHGFKNYAEAKTWAKEHIARTYSSEETGGKGDIRISNAAINKYLSQSAVDKSDSKDVHLSVLKVLPEVIRESVDAEQHADYKKGEDGVRSAKNGINPNVTIHRLYGAVRMDGKVYRVKVTLKEDKTSKEPKVPHSYEATKIELFAGTLGNSDNSLSPNTNNSIPKEWLAGTLVKPKGDNPNTNNSISAAKLLENVGMSYNPDEKVLDASKKRSAGLRGMLREELQSVSIKS